MVLSKKFINNNSGLWHSQSTKIKSNNYIKEYIFLFIVLGLDGLSFLFKKDPLGNNNEIFIDEIEPSELELEEDLESKSVKDSSILEIKSSTFEESSSIWWWEDSINNEKTEKQLLGDEELKLDCPDNKIKHYMKIS